MDSFPIGAYIILGHLVTTTPTTTTTTLKVLFIYRGLDDLKSGFTWEPGGVTSGTERKIGHCLKFRHNLPLT